jgi:hypothetical protein
VAAFQDAEQGGAHREEDAKGEVVGCKSLGIPYGGTGDTEEPYGGGDHKQVGDEWPFSGAGDQVAGGAHEPCPCHNGKHGEQNRQRKVATMKPQVRE